MTVIGEESRFYGYIIGLQLERSPKETGRRLYATFEYNSQVVVWEVPDADLFEILGGHLNDNAWFRKNSDDHGYSKLWIQKKDGKWIIELP